MHQLTRTTLRDKVALRYALDVLGPDYIYAATRTTFPVVADGYFYNRACFTFAMDRHSNDKVALPLFLVLADRTLEPDATGRACLEQTAETYFDGHEEWTYMDYVARLDPVFASLVRQHFGIPEATLVYEDTYDPLRRVLEEVLEHDSSTFLEAMTELDERGIGFLCHIWRFTILMSDLAAYDPNEETEAYMMAEDYSAFIRYFDNLARQEERKDRGVDGASVWRENAVRGGGFSCIN